MTTEYITLIGSAVGNDRDGFRITHHWDGQRFTTKPEAVANGFRLAESDDFNVRRARRNAGRDREGDRTVNIEADAARALGWLEDHVPHHHDTSAAQPAATATIEPATQEAPVSKFSDDLHAIAEKVEHIDDEAITALTAVKANPATATGFALLHELTGFNVSPDFITLGLSVLTELRDRLKTAAASGSPVVATGPTVAGQA
jgi:hypothetical protein